MAKAEAKKEAVAPAKDSKSGKKKGGKAGFFLAVITLGFATPFMLPTIILTLVGMFPTYVALVTDTDRQKSGAISVGAMNFAGLLPFIIDLWQKGQTMPNVIQIMMNANSWLVILGAAAVGQLIVYAIPQAIATMTVAQADMRAKGLRKNLEMLKESWGPDVATVKPVDKIQG